MTINITIPDKKWITTAATILGVVASQYSTQIQAWIAQHPQVVPYLAGAAALLTHYLPSPWQQTKPEPQTVIPPLLPPK